MVLIDPAARSIASRFLLTLRAVLGLVVIATLLGGLTLIRGGTPRPPLQFALAKSTPNQSPIDLIDVPSAIR